MPSLSSEDRVSLCLFTFEDGRRCRTPRVSTSPNFCFYHAQKEAQVRATDNIANDLAYFFSGDYLSANDLNTALSRVFVAVARGDLKPRAARTLAYLAQTMFQTLHLAQNEFITSCGEKDWRHTIVKSINANHAYRFPAPSQPAAPQAPTPPPPVSPQSQTPPQPPTLPTPPSTTCHPERSEGSRRDSTSPTTADPRPASQPAPEPNEPVTKSVLPSPQPRPTVPTRDTYAVHYGHNDRLPSDGKPS